MATFNPKDESISRMHGLLLDAVVPRPIALASTIDKEGRVNLSPFSYFNVFSANPPILIFSPARRGRDATTKHTLDNIHEMPEVVINIVNYEIVHQVSLASAEYPKGVNEFVKAGFEPVHSEIVSPPRVKESPVSFECKVNQVLPLGESGSAGNLVICEVLLMHVHDQLLNENGRIDQQKLDAAARMGQDYYLRASGSNIFWISKPGDKPKVGIDGLPKAIQESKIFTKKDLAILACIDTLPFEGSEPASFTDELLHARAKESLDRGDSKEAWKILFKSDT